jgi:Ca-activated chloride channel family protein
MKNRLGVFFTVFIVLALILNACSQIPGISSVNNVTVTVIYGSEKQEWLDPLVKQYNDAHNKTADGKTIIVQATAMGSIESINGIIDGSLQPTVWSPASSIYIPVANAEWKKTHSDDLVTGTPNNLVLSPVVIAMWRPMAQALGWPEKALGWADLAQLATSTNGWSAYGHPEWGLFKFGHTHPSYSNSGIVSIIAEAYAGAKKQHDLTQADLQSPELIRFMTDLEGSVIHYGSSTGFFADKMFTNGPSYLSAAVMYENLVVAQESKRLSGDSSQIPVVAIYPKEGTFWSNHPYIILNASWVTADQKEAAGDFETFLLDKPQQLKALELGFRPVDPSISLSTPLDAQHGVDVSQPKTVLEIPSAEIINDIQTLWTQVKKPVDLVVVMDISGSMNGKKITSARSSLMEFINKLADRDQLQINLFSSSITTLTPLSALGAKRQQVLNSVSGIFEGGNTVLYDAALDAYNGLKTSGDPKHIRAIIILTDGEDTASTASLDDVVAKIKADQGEGGNSIKLFTIAFGDDADKKVLQQLAEPTGGKQYDSSPETIQKIYDDIATFF